MELETISTLLGFQICPLLLCCFRLPTATTGHILETEAQTKKCILPRSPSGLWLLVDHQKPHIGALLMEIRTAVCRNIMKPATGNVIPLTVTKTTVK